MSEVIRAKNLRKQQTVVRQNVSTYSQKLQRMVDKHIKRYERWADKYFKPKDTANEK